MSFSDHHDSSMINKNSFLSYAGAILFGPEGNIICDSLVQALTIASGFLMVGNIIMSPLVSDLAEMYGISVAKMGITITAYNLPTLFLMLFIGPLADNIGRKPLLIWGLLIYSISGVAIIFSVDFTLSILLRIFQGVGYSLSTPVITAIIGDMYSGAKEATVQGIRVSGNNIVNVIIPVCVSWLHL